MTTRDELVERIRDALAELYERMAETRETPGYEDEAVEAVDVVFDAGWRPPVSGDVVEQVRGKLDQLWGWAKSGRTEEYYLMDRDNVDRFTDDVVRLVADAGLLAAPTRQDGEEA